VEKNKTPVRLGLEYRDAIGYDYEIIKRQMGLDFDIDELPLADVTLLSTFHYYIDIDTWVKYIDRLRAKSCHVLLVSRCDLNMVHWRASANYADVKGYFSDWEELGKVENVSKEGDSKPRDLYSVLFRSPIIRRVPIDSIDFHEGLDNPMFQAMTDLVEQISVDDNIDPLETEFYQRWQERKKGEWRDKMIVDFVQKKAAMLYDVKQNGIKHPFIIRKEGQWLYDGGHRLALLKALGHKSAIVREI
jgi:hypothetical protein